MRTQVVTVDASGGEGGADHRLVGGLGVELERLSEGALHPLLLVDVLAERVAWEAGEVTEARFKALIVEPRAMAGLRLHVLSGGIHPYGDAMLGGALVADHTGGFGWQSAWGPVALLAGGVEGGSDLRWRAAIRGSYTLVTHARAVAVDGVDYGYTLNVSPANATVGVVGGLSF